MAYLNSLLLNESQDEEMMLLLVKLMMRLALLQGSLTNVLLVLNLLRRQTLKHLPFDLQAELKLLLLVKDKGYLDFGKTTYST